MIKKRIKTELIHALKIFWEKGYTPGEDSGDICPRPCEKVRVLENWSKLKEEQVTVIDLNGNYIENNGIFATVEAPMHLEIYKARPEVNVVVHSHVVWSSAFAVTGKNIPLTLAEQTLFLGGEVICAKYGKVGSIVLAKNIVEALGKNKMAAIMRNHGAVVLGKDISHALRLADFLEKGAKTIAIAKILGNVIEIKPNEILDESIIDII